MTHGKAGSRLNNAVRHIQETVNGVVLDWRLLLLPEMDFLIAELDPRYQKSISGRRIGDFGDLIKQGLIKKLIMNATK